MSLGCHFDLFQCTAYFCNSTSVNESVEPVIGIESRFRGDCGILKVTTSLRRVVDFMSAFTQTVF
jgi:hypothetical protein